MPERRNGLAARFAGQPVSDAVQPAGECIAFADGGGLAGQDQKCGLKHVLDVVLVVQHRPAHAANESAVAPHQRREGIIVVMDRESLQELVVGHLVGSQLAQAPDNPGRIPQNSHAITFLVERSLLP